MGRKRDGKSKCEKCPFVRSSCWYKRARHCSTREALFVSDSWERTRVEVIDDCSSRGN